MWIGNAFMALEGLDSRTLRKKYQALYNLATAYFTYRGYNDATFDMNMRILPEIEGKQKLGGFSLSKNDF